MYRFATILLLLFSATAAVSAEEVLTSISAAEQINVEDLTTPRSFAFKGHIFRQANSDGMLSCSEGGISFNTDSITNFPRSASDTVLLRGHVAYDDRTDRRFVGESIEIIGSGDPPVFRPATLTEINSGAVDYKPVTVRGVLSAATRDEADTSVLWCQLRTAEGVLYLTFPTSDTTLDALLALIDAELEVSGYACPISGLRHNLGHHLGISGIDGIRVLSPAPADPRDATPFSIAYSQHRVRASGDVIACSDTRFFIRTGIGCVLAVIPLDPKDIPGIDSHVDVLGFSDYDSYWSCLTAAKTTGRRKSSRPLPPPLEIRIPRLHFNADGQPKIETHLNGQRIRVRGRIRELTPEGMELRDGDSALFIDLHVLRKAGLPAPEVGSLVEATGMCWADFEFKSSADPFPLLRRFVLHPRTADDLTVVSRPPWWTVPRLLGLIGALLAALAGFVIWNLTLKRKAEKRGKALYEERIGHALAEQKVEERTRLAVELHDSLSQNLTGVALQLESGETETATKMLAACRGELRRCLWDLRSRTFEEKDLTEAIEHTLAPHAVGAEISVRFNVPREDLSESTTHAVLRIVRELVVNAIRHGGAKHIKVAGERHGGVMSFSVTDDGAGFDPDRAPGPEQGHFGLLGVRERIEEFNGELEITSAPGAGARFVVTIRLEENPDER